MGAYCCNQLNIGKLKTNALDFLFNEANKQRSHASYKDKLHMQDCLSFKTTSLFDYFSRSNLKE